MMSNGSRWGVKGSSEVSEGLTAVYRYEENLNLANATLGAGNRLSSVGLSGGFGTVTLGQIWSASYNHVGVLTDNGVWSGNQSQTGRTGSALSYSASSGPVSFQIDANMNGDTGRSVDMAQLGMSFDTGAAKVGLAVITKESAKDSTRQSSIGVSVPVGGLTLYSSWSEKEVTTFATPGSEAVVIKGRPDFTVPGSPAFTVPGSPEFTVPGSPAINIPPGEDVVVIEGTPAVVARAGTPDRCLIIRYENATYGTSQRTDSRGRLAYFDGPPPDGDETKRDENSGLPADVVIYHRKTDWPVMDVDVTKIVRDEELAGPGATDTTGGDIVDITHNNEVVPFRFSVDSKRLMETDEYKAWVANNMGFNELTGLNAPAPVQYHCGEHDEITSRDGREVIVASIYQPAVPAVEAVDAVPPVTVKGREGYTAEAGAPETIPAGAPETIPAGAPETIPAGESQTIKGTDDIILTPAVDPTPETTVKTRHMHAGVSGSLGDTGMSFAINVANHPDSSDGENPWNFNVSKSLGGGASLAFEYIDNDSMEISNEALVQLRVDF